MPSIIKIISSKVSQGKRLVKFLRYGKSDTQETKEIAPFGVDSHAPKGTAGLYLETTQRGKPVVVGYINKNQVAGSGELRMYSVDSNGDVVSYIHFKSDGTIEFDGTTDNLSRHSQIAASVNEIKDDINDLKTLISGWVPVATDGGAALKTALATYIATPLVENINDAKIDEIKTL